MGFHRASKSQSKLRAAMFGPSGSGKTFSSLRIAAGLSGTVAVIDTERGSASKYADRFEFDVSELADKSVEGYCQAIREAAGASYNVLIIDSLSHAWQELKQENDRLAATKYKSNTWSAWSESTPKQKRLVDAILSYPGHVIATMRSKTEWAADKDDRGKSSPKRLGMAPEQGKGIEYEFDLLLELTSDHQATVIKDRTGKFQDVILDRPGEEFGLALGAWLNSGEIVMPPVADPRPGRDRDAPRRTNGHGADARPDTWAGWVARCVRKVSDSWDAEVKVERGADVKAEPLANQHQLMNHVASLMISEGIIAEDAIADPRTGKRDRARTLAEVSGYFKRYPEWVKESVVAHIRELRSRERARLGMPDLDSDGGEVPNEEPAAEPNPEALSNATAGDGTAREREPGED